MRLSEGTRLGPYEIVGLLGAGRMGEVYKARDTRLGRLVAVKIVAPDAASDPTRRKRFEREARTISNLAHPHICTLFDTGEEEAGTAFLVMEYLPGETLAHRLLRGSLPLREALQIAVHLADALDAAHRQGVTHRDLKPSNVMLTPAGAKVLDFGLAAWDPPLPDHAAVEGALLEMSGPTLTHPGGVVGTLQYMPPEQFNGRADARSDLFALGAIVFEMVTGRKAFEANTNSAVVAAMESGEAPSMRALEPLAPPALDRVVAKCLLRDPLKRWQTAADLRDELDWIARDLSSSNTRVLPLRTPNTALRRWGLLSAGMAALVVALAVTAVTRLFRSADAAPTTSFVVLPPDNAGSIEQPTISPDGRQLAFIAHMKDGKTALWVRPLESLAGRFVAEADHLAFPFWSPDSQSLAYFNDGQLKRVAAGGGTPQVVCAAPYAHGGSWSPSGVIVFSPSGETPLSKVAAGGSAVTPATILNTSPGELSHRNPQFLSDGRRFIYTVYFTDPGRSPMLRVGSLDDRSAAPVIETSIMKSLVSHGYLLFSRDLNGPLLAQPFDEATLKLRSEPVAIVDRVVDGPIDGAGAVSVSNTGVLAYQTASEAVSQLTWVGRLGRKLGNVRGGAVSLDPDFLSLSKEGTRVAGAAIDAQTHRTDLWVVDAQRGLTSRVTVDGTARDPKWSPDGKRIAFISARRGRHTSDIFLTSANGQGPDEPLVISDTGKFLLDWSSDGAFLLFSEQEGAEGIGNLWVLSLDGKSAPRPYLRTRFHKSEARFSPDAHWVAYQSDEAGRQEIYIQSFPHAVTRYQVSTTGGTVPRWRPDGKELFYLAPDATMMAATVTTTIPLKIGTPSPLFSIPSTTLLSEGSFEVAPDGQRFLIADLVEAVRTPITVVLNWAPVRR